LNINISMAFFYFPSDFVYWEPVENHDEIKRKLMPIIMKLKEEKKNNPFYSSRLNTSFDYNPEKMNQENLFLHDDIVVENVVNKPIKRMLASHNKKNTFNINITNTLVQKAWWNYYEKGNFQEPHTHTGPDVIIDNKPYSPTFSVVYILHDENDGNNTIFQKYPPIPLYHRRGDMKFDTSIVKNQIKEGTVIIFPVGLMHMVKPTLKSGRVTLAFNVISDIA